MEGLAATLASIQMQLTEAAEISCVGGISEALYDSMMRGSVALLPKPPAPHHIMVLKELKAWAELQLITQSVLEMLQREVIAASRVVGLGSESSSTGDSQSTTYPESESSSSRCSGKKRKHGKLPVQNSTLFSVLPGATKTLFRAEDLRKQREAALRNEDYELNPLSMASFPSAEVQPDAKHARSDTKLYPCIKCPRTFTSQLGLRNHMLSHPAAVKDLPLERRERVLPKVECPMRITRGLEVTISFRIRGKSYEDIAAEAAAIAKAEEARTHHLITEAERRRQRRESGAAAEEGEHRQGSRTRRQYTCKTKLKVLEVFDKINDDPQELRKVAAFHAHPGSLGTPYTTVRTHWASPLQRAHISKGASKEYVSTLLRIDKESRKTGKFAAMEKELIILFKARRARGRRVSARWLTSTGRQLMARLLPNEAALFKGGKSWRRRFAKRHNLSQRRKTNVKNKNWADTEPVLLRYFATLRRRLQLDGVDDEVGGDVDDEQTNEDAVEPEPDDVNPDIEHGNNPDVFDSSDDEDPEDSLTTVEMATPNGFKLSELPPQAEQLLYRGARAEELVGRKILFNWRGVGWCDGDILRCNTDGRVKMKTGTVYNVCNFFVHYSDENEGRHCLTLETYGDQGERKDGRWLLLDRA